VSAHAVTAPINIATSAQKAVIPIRIDARMRLTSPVQSK
jgi:hypothetical protein